MLTSSGRRDLVDRLRYTFMTAPYNEIDVLIQGLRDKDNYESLCDEFFFGCSIDSQGNLIPSGFFSDPAGSSSLLYTMYELLGQTPDTFLLKHRVTRIKFLKKQLRGAFRVPRGIFLLPRLEALSIRGIGISKIPREMTQARNLKIVDLAGNRFTEFPPPLLQLPQLSALNLSYNALIELPAQPGRLKHLKILNLRRNKLTRIPATWNRLAELRTLDISMNLLTTIPETLLDAPALRDLRAAYNDMPASEEARWEQGITQKATQNDIFATPRQETP